MKYNFLDGAGNVTESEQSSFLDSQNYADEHDFRCLSMQHDVFVTSFREKIKLFKDHARYSELAGYSEKMVLMNQGNGYQAMDANDFMIKIIIAPMAEIQEWLEGKAFLEDKKTRTAR